MEIIIEEGVLDNFIKETSTVGESPHKGIHNFLISVRMLGYLYRDSHNIVLLNGESQADYDEAYAEYLDKRASGFDVVFNG